MGDKKFLIQRVVAALLVLMALYSLFSYGKTVNNRKKLDTWIGVYGYSEVYEYDEERIQIDFDIMIYKIDENYYAELENKGYIFYPKSYELFLEMRSLAYIKGDGDSIDIFFKGNMPGDSLYGMEERYKEGELMLTLTRKEDGLYSAWYALKQEHPVLCEMENIAEDIYYIKLYENSNENG